MFHSSYMFKGIITKNQYFDVHFAIYSRIIIEEINSGALIDILSTVQQTCRPNLL